MSQTPDEQPDPSEEGSTRRPGLGVGVAAAALIALIAILWFAYSSSDRGSDPTVPRIAAEDGPVRVRPDDPGGLQVPFEDALIFEERDPGEPPPRVEQLLPPPEEPMPRPEPTPAPVETADQSTDAPAQAEPPAPATEADPPAAADPAPEPATQPAPTPAPEPALEPPPAVEPPPAPPATPATTESSPVNRYVQLGSLRSREAAREEWARLQRVYAPQLGDLDLRVEEIDLGDRGRFYRVQGGAVDAAQAAAICAVLKDQNPGGCLVVTR